VRFVTVQRPRVRAASAEAQLLLWSMEHGMAAAAAALYLPVGMLGHGGHLELQRRPFRRRIVHGGSRRSAAAAIGGAAVTLCSVLESDRG